MCGTQRCAKGGRYDKSTIGLKIFGSTRVAPGLPFFGGSIPVEPEFCFQVLSTTPWRRDKGYFAPAYMATLVNDDREGGFLDALDVVC